MGSVKDLEVLKAADFENPGRARFIYSDRYSVFDWGEMPDNIPDKGAAITLLGAYFFEKLEKMNIPTHYVGLVEDGEVRKLSDIQSVTNAMEIDLLPVIHPGLTGDQYDYSAYDDLKGQHLIPLEIIYRNNLPPGSSVFRRLKEGKITPQDLGLDSSPTPNQKLEIPIIDVSTKLEITDRYISWQEAGKISSMSDQEISELKDLTRVLNNFISDEYSKIGLVNEDGKIEVGFDSKRHLMLVDVLGTLDECRFTLNGMPVSKEIARVYYRNTPWYQAVEEAKKTDRQNWKKICRLQPEPLPPGLKKLISQVYCACTNEITEHEWFEDIPPLKEILEEISEYLRVESS
ncbi:phosphoribosylaminoimidazolesuccinocarboxamide synthase [Candidatus Fermentibacteria bacterium]|nr:MAG: phosphoribosylaminoimidazolesuccinocarboxamide synthase [Candidatus Fermentibacteria bacterium]